MVSIHGLLLAALTLGTVGVLAAPPEARAVNASPDNTVRVDSAQKYWYVLTSLRYVYL